MATDDGVWLCCVGCFQNSSPQTSLVIRLRKVQPDPLAFFILSVPGLWELREGGWWLCRFLLGGLVLRDPSQGTLAFLEGGRIVAPL